MCSVPIGDLGGIHSCRTCCNGCCNSVRRVPLRTPAAQAAEKLDAKSVAFFESKIRPVLVNSCYECHSAKSAKVKGGLLLDTRDGIRKGGDKGHGIVPGKLEESLVVTAMQHTTLKMPPKAKLPDSVIADFEEWVKMGAPDPRDEAGVTAYKRLSLEEAKSFWSFKPVQKPQVPSVKDTDWARDDIDRFILAKLDEKGLKPVADADKRTLIRRVYFDLIGLPPTPEEVEAFLNDKTPEAFSKIVDKLLASPHYGERWGRHWLDVARYAETNGNTDNNPFPYAYKYRDYVIEAFNSDKPYTRFVQEQIAGDLLPSKDAKEKDSLVVATGFLALTSKPRPQNNPDYRFDLIADQIDVTSRAVLGLSVMCARCHDHKFDPISTKEYYGLAGVFDSTQMFSGATGKVGNGKGGVGGLLTLSDGSQAMGIREGKVIDCQVCLQGESTKLGESVPHGVLAVATPGAPPKFSKAQSGRLELANWLTTAENPMTARVAVNRIWLHLFGEGILRSPDNFGFLGERPSHPELIDHLASRFVDSGWSTKQLIRSMVLSHAYQMASTYDERTFNADPNNVLVWRMPQRRLEGEAIRDAVLAVSGRLDPTPAKGNPTEMIGGKGKKAVYGSKESNHRSVYLGVPRGAPLPEILAVFDIASPNLSVTQREITTVPIQALFMMNSNFIADQSMHLAERLLADTKLDDAGRVKLAYELAYTRLPTQAERARALDFIQKHAGTDKKTQTAAWASLGQAIYASAEFRYID